LGSGNGAEGILIKQLEMILTNNALSDTEDGVLSADKLKTWRISELMFLGPHT